VFGDYYVIAATLGRAHPSRDRLRASRSWLARLLSYGAFTIFSHRRSRHRRPAFALGPAAVRPRATRVRCRRRGVRLG
jgi:hypothetical protein